MKEYGKNDRDSHKVSLGKKKYMGHKFPYTLLEEAHKFSFEFFRHPYQRGNMIIVLWSKEINCLGKVKLFLIFWW